MSHCCRLPITSIDARQDGRPSRANLLGARDVVVARRLQATELLESVGVDGRPIGDVPGREVGQRGLAEIRDDGHAGPARAGSALLDGDGHKRRFSALQLPTPAQTRLWSTHPRVVDFDLPVQGVPGGVDHGSPEFVQDPPGRLIPTDAQLVLQQQRRDPSLVGRHQIRGPKPHRQRHLRPVEDGARCQRHLVATRCAFPPPPPAQRVGPAVAAAWTLKAVRPAARLQVLLARLLVGELPLKLLDAGRERRTRHARTLHIEVS